MLAKLFALSWPEQKLVLKASWLFVFWHLTIRYLPYSYWRKAITQPVRKHPVSALLPPARIISLCEKVARHHWVPINCLRRCMVERSLLRRAGIECVLRFGVKHQQQTVDAHCWLEINNLPINDTQENITQYAILDSAASILK